MGARAPPPRGAALARASARRAARRAGRRARGRAGARRPAHGRAGRPGGREPLHERALALAREAGDDRRAAWALHGLGDVAYGRGELARARELFEESLALFLELGELGPRRRTAELPRERRHGRRGHRRRSRPTGSAAREHVGARPATAAACAAATHGLGDLALEAGDGERALAHYAEALEVADLAWRTTRITANCLAGHRGRGRAAGGTAGEAARLWAAAQRLDAEHRGPASGASERARYERFLGSLPAVDGELGVEDALSLARALVI